MDSEEFKKLCDELRAQYSAVAKKEHPKASEDEIADMCDAAIMNEIWQMFLDEKIEKEDLVKMAGQLGFEPTDEFTSKDEVTVKGDTQTIPNEGGPDLKVGSEEIKEAQGYNDNNEESERKEARKLFGFDDEEEKEKEKEEDKE